MNLLQSLYIEQTPEALPEWEAIAEKLQIKLPTEEELWEVIREYEAIPHVSNVYCHLLFVRIQARMETEFYEVTIDYYINGMLDTRLYINEEEINTLQEYEDWEEAYSVERVMEE